MIIKFSHIYNKFPRDFQHSKLLEVLPVRLEDLSLDFILYDTSYNEGGEEKQYALPEKGEYMILMLLSPSGCLWTTIRSRWGGGYGVVGHYKADGGRDKMLYYKSHIGEWVECVISE